MRDRTPLTRLLGIECPIIQGPFCGQGACVELAAAISSAGGLGSFGVQTLDGEQILRTIRAIRSRTSRAFAANLWMPKDDDAPAPALALPAARGAPDLVEQLQAVLEARPPVLSFTFGIPSPPLLRLCRQRGIITTGAAASPQEAMALERAGVDCVVACGHAAGVRSDYVMRPPQVQATEIFSLLPSLVASVRLPVIAAGGIGDAGGIAAALALGAQGVQIGPAFLACWPPMRETVRRCARPGCR